MSCYGLKPWSRRLRITTNSIQNMFRDNFSNDVSNSGFLNYPLTRYVVNDATLSAEKQGYTTIQVYNGHPAETSNETDVEKSWYRDYYKRYYKHYAVTNTEVTLTVQNIGTIPQDNIVIGWQWLNEDKEPPMKMKQTAAEGISIAIFDGWKDTTRVTIPANKRQTIYKNFITGKSNAEAIEMHTVSNNKVQSEVWTPCSSEPVSKDQLYLYFWRDPLSAIKTDQGIFGCNIEVHVKQTVVFRDLKKFVEFPTGWEGTNYPGGTATDVITHVPDDFVGRAGIEPS